MNSKRQRKALAASLRRRERKIFKRAECLADRSAGILLLRRAIRTEREAVLIKHVA